MQIGNEGRKLKLLLDRSHGEQYWAFLPLIDCLSTYCDVTTIKKKPVSLESIASHDVLLLISPKKAGKDIEVEAVREFVEERGGILLVMTAKGRKPNNLNKLLEPYGMSVSDDKFAEQHLDRSDLNDSPLLDGVEVLTQDTTAYRSTQIATTDQAEILLQYRDAVLGAKSTLGNGAAILFTCLPCFEKKLLDMGGNRRLINNLLRSMCKSEMIATLEAIERNESAYKHPTLSTLTRAPRVEALTGSVEECWSKDFKELELGRPLAADIALETERVVIGGLNEFHTFDFEGTRERSQEFGGKITSIAVTSDCSKALLCSEFPRAVVYTLSDGETLELDLPRDEEARSSMSLDGKLLMVECRREINLWNWNGVLLWRCEESDRFIRQFQIGLAAFEVVLAPNGRFIAWKHSGSARSTGWCVLKTPRMEELLGITDDQQRFDFWGEGTWLGESLPEGWLLASASASDDRLCLYRERDICVLDVSGETPDVLLCEHELLTKPAKIISVEMTSDGQYLLFTSYNRHEKMTNLNLFDIEAKKVIPDLIKFPRNDVRVFVSHDGSTVVALSDWNVQLYSVS